MSMDHINITGGELHLQGDIVFGDKHVHLPPAPPRAFVAPFQMPGDLDTFVGRADTLQILAGLGAFGTTQPRFMLTGIGGLGKTALAIHIAHLLKSAFNGGVLWADVPTTEPFTKLDEWARLYGGDVREYQTLDARADALRAILQANALTRQGAPPRKILVVLDGAVDENDDAKLAALLRALHDCAVLATTRAKNLPSLYTFREIPVKNFDASDAVALFEKILPTDTRLSGNQAKIHALGAKVDWLPFALELLAKQLVKHREWTLDDLDARLAQSVLDALQWSRVQTKDTAVRASFLLSYKGLTENEQTFFTQLGAFGGQDFDVQAATVVAPCGDATAENILEHLLELSMAQTGRAVARYTFHALMREFARELCGKNLYDAELRMATYYCKLARENGNKLQGKELDQALAILDLEVSNIFAGQKWAREDETRAAQELTRDYIIPLAPYFGLRANWAEWIKWSEYGIAACRALEDERGESAIAGNLGIVYRQKGEWDKAIELYQSALITLERLGDAHGMAQTLNNLGLAYFQKGEWNKALEYYQESLAAKERLGDAFGMAQTFNNLGLVYANKGEWDKAIEFYQNALQTMERLDDAQGMAQALNNLGMVYGDKGEWDKAIEYYQQSLAAKERLGDAQGMAQTHDNLGLVYANKGEWDKAIEYYQQSLAAKERLGDTYGMAQTFNNLGMVYEDKGEWDKAIELYQRSLAAKERLGDAYGMAQTFNNLGAVYADKGEWDKATTYYQNAMTTMERVGDVYGLAQTYVNLGNVHFQKSEWDKALEYYQQALATKERLGDIPGVAQIHVNLGSAYLQKGEWDKALEFYQKALTTQERIGDAPGIARTYGNLGMVYANKGEWDKAIELYQQSLVAKERLDDAQGMAQTYMNLGNVYFQKNEPAKTLELYQQALEIKERLSDAYGIAKILYNLGYLYGAQGDLKRALEYAEKALAIFEKLGAYETAQAQQLVEQLKKEIAEKQ